MESIKQNIEYIQKSILNNTHREQQAIIALIISETVTTIKEATFSYDVPCVPNKSNAHFAVITNKVKQAKSSLISDLQELEGELKRNNTKRCLNILQKMLECNLYMNDVQQVIDGWKGLTKKELTKKTLRIK